jgi:hypothetical protein
MSYCMNRLSPLENFPSKDTSSTYSHITHRDCFPSGPKLLASRKRYNALPRSRLKKIDEQTASSSGVQLIVSDSSHCNHLLSHIRHWETHIQPLNSYTISSSETFTELLTFAPLLSSKEVKEKCKSCTCKKSHCLKQYCECFAAKRACEGCKCMDCYNKTSHNELREEAINISKTNKLNGCYCKRIRCLKKYCDCYQRNAQCNDNCRCEDCYNKEKAFN